MRSFAILAVLPLLATAAPASIAVPAGSMPVQNPYADKRCPETPMSLARKQGDRPRSLNLAELPPATAFAAVDRRVGGCPMPMLMRETRR